jgi:osmoprotectant transport system permease protein
LPIALPAMMAGVRIATVSTVALTTVGVVVGNGGLGQIIFEGFNNNFYRAEIATGSLLVVALALVADGLLAGLTRVLAPWHQRVRT